MNIIIIIFSLISIIGTFLPKNDSKHWFVRGQASFRAIYLILNVVMLILVIFLLPFSILKIFLGIFLALSTFLCLRSILPYSILYPKTIKTAKVRNGKSLKILVHNVYQFNDEYQKEIDLVQREDPDIVILLEVNEEWDNAMTSLKEKYSHVAKEIREDTYGILMMSKIKTPVKNINYLVSKDIPSSEMLIEIGNRNIRILGIHPEPPIPGEVLTSKPKDKEILNSAKYINSLPTDELKVLVGDFNDVAWSKISKRFKNMTGLKDVRIGRGFFSTFPSYSPIQIPLDHVFCSSEFKILDFQVLDPQGSDHHPVAVTFKIPA